MGLRDYEIIMKDAEACCGSFFNAASTDLSSQGMMT